MVLTVFAGLAEFERALIIDRTRNGREAAKARGVKFGPRTALTAPSSTTRGRSSTATAARSRKWPPCWVSIVRPCIARLMTAWKLLKASSKLANSRLLAFG